jgi:HAD superfamily hydrolase (TIGR01509 family)
MFLPACDRGRLEKPLRDLRSQIFHRDYMPRVVPFARAHDLLVRVRQSGMRIVLATSSEEEDLATYGELLGMDDLVDEASSSADAKSSKPSPDIFAAALKKAGIRPEQAIALGDTPWDAQAASKLNIPVIGLTCGGWKQDDLRDGGCVEVWQDPADLLLHYDDSILQKQRA